MLRIIDGYPTILIKDLKGDPVGKAYFNEPVFKGGIFQNQTIKVEVILWPSKIIDRKTNETLIAVRFGEMAFLRYVLLSLLEDIKYF